jgi:hypothetical protein
MLLKDRVDTIFSRGVIKIKVTDLRRLQGFD